MESAATWQAQTDADLAGFNTKICGNDYLAPGVQVQLVRNLFASPNPPTNPDPRPVFAAINCISNSPNRRYREVLINEFYNGGGAQDFSTRIAEWRTVLDSVQAPAPEITDARATTGGVFRFTVPGQRGRTNRVQSSTNLTNWITVTNITGTNAAVVVRETNIFPNPRRFYRLVRF